MHLATVMSSRILRLSEPIEDRLQTADTSDVYKWGRVGRPFPLNARLHQLGMQGYQLSQPIEPAEQPEHSSPLIFLPPYSIDDNNAHFVSVFSFQ